MQGNREGRAKTFPKTFPTFRASTKCREIGKARQRLSLRLEPALNEGNREGRAKTFPTFRARTKCREIGKVGRRLSLRLEPALNVGK